MRFSRKIGRPKSSPNEADLGTAELQQKRLQDLTTEPLDLCLKKEIITKKQFAAGNHLRWLYTLHFGTPELQAYKLDLTGISCAKAHNEKWLKKRKNEYDEILKSLNNIRAQKIVMNVCVFRQKVIFLDNSNVILSSSYARERKISFLKFKEGMALLEKLTKG